MGRYSVTRRQYPKVDKLAGAVAVALAVPLAHKGHAQEESSTDQLEQVVVTGSRIVRRDYSANSPIQTIEAAQFQQQTGIAVEETLNELPQFVPAATAYTQVQDGELIFTGATTTSGSATLSLRGLGPNRNLVLIDGYRAMPINATMAVDVNTIPAAAIERVEVITGGASSVYGADAVAGVVNFILRDDFEGVDLDFQYGQMQNGEAPTSRMSALFGTSTGDGRGNVMIGIDYSDRDGVEWKDVDFYEKAMTDPTVAGTVSIMTDPYISISSANPPDGGVIDSIFSEAPAGVVLRNSAGEIGGRVYMNDDNTLYTGGAIFDGVSPAGPGSTEGLYRYNGPLRIGDFQFRKIDATGELEEFIPGHKANVPLERFSTFARASYELTDGISAYVQVNNVESNLLQLWQVSPATGGWSQIIPHGSDIYEPSLAEDGSTLPAYQAGGNFGLDCPAMGGCTESQAFPVSPELGALLDSREDPNASWNLNFSLDFPYFGLGVPRQIDSTNRMNQLSLGLRGDVAGIDGGWDFVASHGTTTLGLLLQGYASLERVRTVIESPNYGRGFFAQANSGPPGNGFAGGVSQCTSGVPVFRPHDDVTQDCLDAMIVELQHQSKMEQDFVEANLEGRLVDMPAGEARFAAGTHWRENTYRYIFDTLNTQDSFLDLGLGTFPANSTRGSTSVSELYGELFLPLVSDVTGVQHLNLELGYRYSDYELQGGIDTYKALVDWGITDELRFRGGRQLATRAPNIAEMFQAQAQTWSAATPGDPCGLETIATYGANPEVNPDAAQARAICEELMGSGSIEFYDPANIQPNGVVDLWFVNAVGNPNVDPEEATTWTAGLVYQPSSRGLLLNGLSASIDWYKIEISDMIAVEPGAAVYEACLSTASNPSGDPSDPACQRIIRNPQTGGGTASNVSYINAGDALVSGVDISADWRVDLTDVGIERIPGYFGINMMLNTLLDLETQATSSSPTVDWTGTLGPTPGTSLNNGAFDYRLFTSFNYGFSDWNFSLRWRYLPEADPAERAVTTGPIPNLGAESDYNVFDFSAGWNFMDTAVLRFGIDNVFDKEPVITGGRNELSPNPTSGQGTTEAGFYDILGRRFYMGVNFNF